MQRKLLELLEHGLLPVIPGKGSVGASGDLAQLAHLAQPLVGEGRLRRVGDRDPHGHPSAELLAEEGVEPLTLAAKEGLSLINGTEPMQVLLALAIDEVTLLVRVADIACAMSVEALLGTDRPYDERVPVIRSAGVGRQPAPDPRRQPPRREPPRERPRGAGLLLPALRPASSRRRP